MNYEIKSAIDRKADQWKVDGLSQELDRAKQDIQELNSQLDYAKGRIQNQSEALRQLIAILTESGNFPDYDNTLHSINQYL